MRGNAGSIIGDFPDAVSTPICSVSALVRRAMLPGVSSPARAVNGRYDPAFPFEECLTLAQEVKGYENAYLTQQISFLETIHEFFSVHNLQHDQERYDLQMRSFFYGDLVPIMVFHEGELEKHQITKKLIFSETGEQNDITRSASPVTLQPV